MIKYFIFNIGGYIMKIEKTTKIGELLEQAPEKADILLEAGSDMSKVIKVSIFLKNIEDFALVNEVYATYFNKPYPARSCVAVKALPKDVVLEMEAIALK